MVKNASDSESESASQPGPSTILKYRFPKTYRHPTLDASLTRLRLASEARALARCLRHGVRVPRVVFVDEKSGVLGLERIEGWSVREVLGGGAEGEVEDEVEEEEEREVAADGVEKEEEEELGAGEGEEEREEIVVKLGNVNMGQEDGGLGGAASGNSRVNNDGPGNRSHPSGSGDRSQGLDDDAPEHEGMTALKRLGVTQGESALVGTLPSDTFQKRPSVSPFPVSSARLANFSPPHVFHRCRPGQATPYHSHSWRFDDFQYDDPADAECHLGDCLRDRECPSLPGLLWLGSDTGYKRCLCLCDFRVVQSYNLSSHRIVVTITATMKRVCGVLAAITITSERH